MQTTISGQNITITFGNSKLGTIPTTYYYSKDNGKTYTSSTSNIYTYTGLTPFTAYTFKAYSVDALGNTSRILTTNAEITYVFEKLFSYSNQVQSVTIDVEGYYKLETWGAQGGVDTTYQGGYGGYSIGYVYINPSTTLYITVGGAGGYCKGTSCTASGGYNGGGACKAYSDSASTCGGGGGATHVATSSGVLSSLSGNKGNILIVAGGGGGGNLCNTCCNYASGGSGGGATAQGAVNTGAPHFSANGGTGATGGTQTSGYAFGQGQGGTSSMIVGAGGGYYGGKSSTINGAGGGSGYIGNSLLVNKSMYCYNCTANSAESTKTFSSTCHSANATENCAKEGAGYAKITYVGQSL